MATPEEFSLRCELRSHLEDVSSFQHVLKGIISDQPVINITCFLSVCRLDVYASVMLV
jgi:hypothetical protein